MTTVHTLASGSSGNALLLSCGGSHVLLDAGISCRRVTAALRELGLEPGSLSAILITHTHADHISGLQTLLKRCGAPVFATERAGRELRRAQSFIRGRHRKGSFELLYLKCAEGILENGRQALKRAESATMRPQGSICAI